MDYSMSTAVAGAYVISARRANECLIMNVDECIRTLLPKPRPQNVGRGEIVVPPSLAFVVLCVSSAHSAELRVLHFAGRVTCSIGSAVGALKSLGLFP